MSRIVYTDIFANVGQMFMPPLETTSNTDAKTKAQTSRRVSFGDALFPTKGREERAAGFAVFGSWATATAFHGSPDGCAGPA